MFFVQNEQSDVLSILFLDILPLRTRYFRLPDGKTAVLRQPESHSIGQNKCRATLFSWRKQFFRLLYRRAGEKKARFRVRRQRKRVKGEVRARFQARQKRQGILSYRSTKISFCFLNCP